MLRSRQQRKTFSLKDEGDVLKTLTMLKGMFKTNQPLLLVWGVGLEGG